MKKAILTLCIFLINTYGFGQFLQDWNYHNFYNPATSGFYHQHEAVVANNAYGASLSEAFRRSIATYSVLLDKKNIGLGFSYQLERYPSINQRLRNDNEIKLNANKQFAWNNDKLLSIGLGAGVAINSQQYYVEPFPSYSSFIEVKYFNEPIFTSDIGAAFKWKRWNANVSVNHFLNNRANELQNPKHLNFVFFTDYVFGKKEGFQIRPQISFHAENGFQRLKSHLQFSYQTKYFIGMGVQNRDTWFGSAGVLIREKFRLNYSFGWINSKLSKAAFNELNLAFLFNRRDTY